MNFLKNRKEWLEVLHLSWPPILESLLLSLARYIDSAMLGARPRRGRRRAKA